MSETYKQPFPDYLEKRSDKEHLKWHGQESSLEFFPHLNLNWKQIKKIYSESNKPVGDLGASFSTLPVEGELRGIDILPIDIMHGYHRWRYQGEMEKEFEYLPIRNIYDQNRRQYLKMPKEMQEAMGIENPPQDYWKAVDEAIKKVMDKYIVADLAHIPLEDKSLSISIVHDVLPKHSPDFKTFLEKQLPEILRVTDQAVYIYPMVIYEVIEWIEDNDPKTGEPYWKEASEFTPEELRWIKTTNQMTPEQATRTKSTLDEKIALYRSPEHLKQIIEVADKLGFEFNLEKGSETEKERNIYKSNQLFKKYDEFTRHEQKEAKLGVFIRKQTHQQATRVSKKN